MEFKAEDLVIDVKCSDDFCAHVIYGVLLSAHGKVGSMCPKCEESAMYKKGAPYFKQELQND